MTHVFALLFLAMTVKILIRAGTPTKFVDYTRYSDLVRLRGQEYVSDLWRVRYKEFSLEDKLPPSTFKITTIEPEKSS